MRAAERVTVIVPTLGASPHLEECLARLGAEGVGAGGVGAPERIVVDQRPSPTPIAGADRLLTPGRNLGFAGGVDLGLREAGRELVAVVNDDLLPEPGWLGELVGVLDRHPRAAAAQGVNLGLEDPSRVDGCGIAFNRFWRPVQIGQGVAPPATAEGVREVFGCSATAVLYRREALAAVAGPGGAVFDERLVSYYEDVELATRLRAAGWTALVALGARALHAGSVTSRGMPWQRRKLHFANRYLVLASLLGRSLWPRLPGLLARDLVEILGEVASGSPVALVAAVAGWGRAARLLGRYGPRGAPAIPMSELRRFRVPRAAWWPW